MQLFLGMMVYPNEFRKVKMLAVSTPKLKRLSVWIKRQIM